jgi:hypothetical protein
VFLEGVRPGAAGTEVRLRVSSWRIDLRWGWAATGIPTARLDDAFTLVLAGLLLGVVNAVVRPILAAARACGMLLTLGLFRWSSTPACWASSR